MNEQKYDNSGTLWPRSQFETREQNDRNKPHATGAASLNCPHCKKSFSRRLAAWWKDRAEGGQFLSLAFTEPQEKENGQ